MIVVLAHEDVIEAIKQYMRYKYDLRVSRLTVTAPYETETTWAAEVDNHTRPTDYRAYEDINSFVFARPTSEEPGSS